MASYQESGRRPASAERGTNQLSEQLSPNEKKEHEIKQFKAWEKILGPVKIKPYQDKITRSIEKNLKESGFDTVFIPKIDLGTLESLQKDGVDEHIKKIHKRYPKFKFVDTLPQKELDKHGLLTFPERCYWQDVYDRSTEFPTTLNNWVAIESHNTSDINKIPKGDKQSDKLLKELELPSRVNNSWNDVHDTLLQKGTEILHKNIKLMAADEELGILSLIDRSLYGNLKQIDHGSKNLELTNTKYIDINGTSIYTTGHSGGGGSGCAIKISPRSKSSAISFRAAIFFERP